MLYENEANTDVAKRMKYKGRQAEEPRNSEHQLHIESNERSNGTRASRRLLIVITAKSISIITNLELKLANLHSITTIAIAITVIVTSNGGLQRIRGARDAHCSWKWRE